MKKKEHVSMVVTFFFFLMVEEFKFQEFENNVIRLHLHLWGLKYMSSLGHYIMKSCVIYTRHPVLTESQN